jgi:BirA family biotin operon repressor/biotin-[acetyl-CoA-carboxylase] ligase
VVGVGLNIRPQPAEGLDHGYACLQELQAGITAPLALARVAEPLVRELLRFSTQGFAPRVAAYARRDLLRGRMVTTTLAEVPQGVAEGVDERGALRVRSDRLHHVSSGSVSVRLPPFGAAPPCNPSGGH